MWKTDPSIDYISGTESAYAESRKGMPVYRGVLAYFPDALKEVSKVSLQGNIQHHPDKELHWDKNKSTCLLYTSPSPRDGLLSRMPSSA